MNTPEHMNNKDRATGTSLNPIEKASSKMKMSLTKLLVALPLAAATFVAMPDSARAQEACTSYTVQTGDTLGSIAEAAYGSFDYQTIFNANRNLITNPNTLETGIVLQLPCADGNLPGAATAKQIIETQEAKASAQASTSNLYEPPIRVVTGNGWEPYVGERLNGGGMLIRLIGTALNRGGNSRDFNVSFVDDWAAHYETLLPLGAFDISVAWYIPDCTKVDLLSDGMKWRCNDVDASLPIYESVVGFYTLAGNEYESVRDHSELAGARICRMEGFFTHDLDVRGLVEPLVTLVRPKTIQECFDNLMDGKVDVVSLEIESVAGAAADMGIADKLVENPYLNDIISMSFVAHKTNPRGKVYLALLNRGITEMRESGEWYAIISDSLAEFNGMKTN